mmetsp:Transcript_20419/g.30993  ORF Transcript_20419/g.30993 Transcript_20419/m.30993 type:complete len:192 (-) Transcript_20419:94-669(-)
MISSALAPANRLGLLLTGSAHPFTTFSIPQAAAVTASYVVASNTLYLARRSYLRKMTMRRLWKIRTTREPNVTFQLYCIMLFTWQAFVFTFPMVELIARIFRHVSFFYTYPNANGVGIIFEPRNVQHLKQSKRVRNQVRFDWHRFHLNMGGIGRDGYKHPPSRVRNLPHIDCPQKKLKHWPWRRKFKKKDT